MSPLPYGSSVVNLYTTCTESEEKSYESPPLGIRLDWATSGSVNALYSKKVKFN